MGRSADRRLRSADARGDRALRARRAACRSMARSASGSCANSPTVTGAARSSDRPAVGVLSRPHAPEIEHLGLRLRAPLRRRGRVRGRAPPRRGGGGRDLHQDQPARRHRRCSMVRRRRALVRRGAAERAAVHRAHWRRKSPRRRPTSRRGSRANSNSIRTSGSSRSRTVKAAIFLTMRWCKASPSALL